MTRVLVITGANVGSRMSGPAIRASAMARVLAADGHTVVLASTAAIEAGYHRDDYRLATLRPGDQKAFAALHREADVVIFQGHAMEQFPALAVSDRVVIADAYDPMHLEMLEQGRDEPRATWDLLVRQRVALLNQQLTRADLILCASERQRSFYLGHLAALGRVSPTTYLDDPQLERLLAVVPFGIDSIAPGLDRPALRGVIPGLDADSRILLWGGGIYAWFDPLLLIRAVHALAQRRPNVVLVFLGTRHPGSEPMGIVKQAMELADELGALGTSVVFNEDWVPYDERGAYFLEADAGVSTHHAHVETEFSFRTRILDYLWARLPMVVTEGDTFADLVKSESLGIVVPSDDLQALEEALERVLFDSSIRSEAATHMDRVRQGFMWETTLEPVRRLAREPRQAADVRTGGGRDGLARSARSLVKDPRPPGLLRDLHLAWHYGRNGGPGEVVRRFRAKRARQ